MNAEENDVTHLLEEEAITHRQENRLLLLLCLFLLSFLSGIQISTLTLDQRKTTDSNSQDFLNCYPRKIKLSHNADNANATLVSFVCGNNFFEILEYDETGSNMMGGLMPPGKTLRQIGCKRIDSNEIACHEEGSAMNTNLHRSFVARKQNMIEEAEHIEKKETNKSNKQKRMEILNAVKSLPLRVRMGEISKEEAKIEAARLKKEYKMMK